MNDFESFFQKKKLETKERFNRILPFGDYISNRWEKAEFCGFGEGTSVYDTSLIFGNVKVGKNCWIGPFTILDGSGGSLVIDDNCNVSAGVQIYTHDTVDRVIYGRKVNKADVCIGKNVYIGPNVVISKGVMIGDYVVIGANSFVNIDIPSRSKAYGLPVKVYHNEVDLI